MSDAIFIKFVSRELVAVIDCCLPTYLLRFFSQDRGVDVRIC